MFTITNITQMPPYITSNDFDTWFDKFNTALRGIGCPPFPASGINIGITFSEKEETSLYGFLSIEELKDRILSTWGCNEEILKILKRIKVFDNYREEIQNLTAAIENIRIKNEALPSSRILQQYWDDRQFSIPVLGRYSRFERVITLFTKNIEAAAKEHGNPPEREFEKTFIHELFHAYHYIDRYGADRIELKRRKDYTSRVVKESLASAFEWNYCITSKIAGYDSLRDDWEAYSILSYPYSGAIELLVASTTISSIVRVEHLDNKNFREVFELSLSDMDGALRLLLDANLFYKIKNIIYIREKVITAPTTRITYADFEAMFVDKKIGQIAQEEIPPIVAKKPHLVTDLLDDVYSDTTFGISAAVLSITQAHYPCGDRIYYTNTKAIAAGNEYYLFMHWKEKHRQNLLKWLWTNKM